MTKFYIEDYDLSTIQLEDKYSPEGDGQHPGYIAQQWRREVLDHDTRLGYWEWVKHKLTQEEDELSRDNPYTQHI